MDLPVNIYYWLLSIVPIVFLLVLMAKFQWGASKAASLTLVITILISVIFFRANTMVIVSEVLKAIWSSLSIILVIITAILLYEIGNEAQSFSVFNKAFDKIAPNELIKIILIGIVFASFLQGIAGFGVPVLITAPLLLAIGVTPIWAVIIPLLGHCWAGTFGTLALAWQALIMQVAVEDVLVVKEIALYASIFLFILNAMSFFIVSFSYGGWKGIKKGFLAIIPLSIIQGGGQVIFSMINPNLAVFVPSALSLLMIIILSKTPIYRETWSISDSKIMVKLKQEEKAAKEHMTFNAAAFPYYIMTFIALTVLLIKPINSFLNSFSYGPSFRETITGFGVVNPMVSKFSPLRPFTHASMFLLISGILGYYYYHKTGKVGEKSWKKILQRTMAKAYPTIFAVIFLISISRIMMGTGQTEILAQGVANILGNYYGVISPFIGLLGSFITGSNMSSNILFGSFQMKTAEIIGLNSSQILGGHTAAGSVGITITPSSILLGTTTTGIVGSEGKILKKTMVFALTVVSLFGVILFILNMI